MTIGINASFLRKPDSGTGQVTKNFLRTLIEMSKKQALGAFQKANFILYLEQDIDWQLPENFQKRIFLPPYKRDDLIRKIWWEYYLLPQKAKEDKCEIFFSLYQSTTILKNIKHIMLVHDTVWKIFPQYLNNIRKNIYYALVDRAIKAVDHILTVSENSKEDIKKFYQIADEKITVAYDDCDPMFKKEVSEQEIQSVKQKYNLNSEYIFYIGGFDVRKNVDRIIEAYGRLLKEFPDAPDLVLAGSFHQHLVPLITDIPNKVAQITKEAGVAQDKIKQLGFVPQEEVPALYHGARLFCYPSLYEGFGIPVLEAYNTGCPLVTSNTSSIKEIADHQSALIVDPTNIEVIAHAMRTGLEDDSVRQRIIQGGLEKAKQFSWESFTQKVLEHFCNS